MVERRYGRIAAGRGDGMTNLGVIRTIAAAAAALLLLAPGAAQAPAGPLGVLQPGLWQLRSLGASAEGPARTICVRNPGQLLQLRHAGRACTRRVLSQDSSRIEVRYECRGGGWGQTMIRVETPRLAHVDTQGVAGATPFHDVYEARRTGACG